MGDGNLPPCGGETTDHLRRGRHGTGSDQAGQATLGRPPTRAAAAATEDLSRRGDLGQETDRADALVARWLRRIRLSRRLSKVRLAAGLGVSYQQIQKYEAAHNRISAGRLLMLARVLDLDLAPLLAEFQADAEHQGLPFPGAALDWSHLSEDSERLALAFERIASRQLRQAVLAMVESISGNGPEEC